MCNGVKAHAEFEHDKVRYLQNSVIGLLNIKQNQIVKVFTIITAVFRAADSRCDLLRHEFRRDAGVELEARVHHVDRADFGCRAVAADIHQAQGLAAIGMDKGCSHH